MRYFVVTYMFQDVKFTRLILVGSLEEDVVYLMSIGAGEITVGRTVAA